MNIEFINTVDRYLPPAHVDQLIRIEAMMSQLQFDEHYILLQNNVFEDIGHEHAYVIYFNALRTYLDKTGVNTDPTMSTEMEVVLGEALLALTEPDNIDVLDLLLQIDDIDDSYTLAVLLAELTEYDITRWYTALNRVDPALIIRLKSLSSSEELVDEAQGFSEEVRKTFKRYFDGVETNNSNAILSSIKTLPIVDKVGLSQLDWESSPGHLGIELLMVLVLSGIESKAELLTVSAEILESRYTDFNVITQISMVINEFLREAKDE